MPPFHPNEEEDMSDGSFLLMAKGAPDSTTKIVEISDDRNERIHFRPPEHFKAGKPFYEGDAVHAKMKELAYEEMEAGHIKPGFVVVPKNLVEKLSAVEGVERIGTVEHLSRTYKPTAFVEPEPAPEPEQEYSEVNVPLAEPKKAEKYTCEFCGGAGRKGFSKEGYINHLQGFHLKGLRHKGQGEITDEDRATWDKINAILEGLGEYA